MRYMKTFFFTIPLCSLLLTSCGRTKFEPVRPEVKSEQTHISENYDRSLTIADKNILVEVVDTDNARKLGLSYRPSLENNRGMLFDFTNTTDKRPSFWMKDMRFSIDIIWINNGTVVGIEKNAPVPTETTQLPTYTPPTNISHVLEVPSGWSDKNNIRIGNAVVF